MPKSSIYKGVTFCKNSQRWCAYVYQYASSPHATEQPAGADSTQEPCRQSRKRRRAGNAKQPALPRKVTLGLFDTSEDAARARDVALLYLSKGDASTNLPRGSYKDILEELLATPTFDMVVASLRQEQKIRRKVSSHQGVTRDGTAWKVQMKIFGSNFRIGKYEEEDQAARAFDGAVLFLDGSRAVTNFSDYDRTDYEAIARIRAEQEELLQAYHSRQLRRRPSKACSGGRPGVGAQSAADRQSLARGLLAVDSGVGSMLLPAQESTSQELQGTGVHPGAANVFSKHSDEGLKPHLRHVLRGVEATIRCMARLAEKSRPPRDIVHSDSDPIEPTPPLVPSAHAASSLLEPVLNSRYPMPHESEKACAAADVQLIGPVLPAVQSSDEGVEVTIQGLSGYYVPGERHPTADVPMGLGQPEFAGEAVGRFNNEALAGHVQRQAQEFVAGSPPHSRYIAVPQHANCRPSHQADGFHEQHSLQEVPLSARASLNMSSSGPTLHATSTADPYSSAQHHLPSPGEAQQLRMHDEPPYVLPNLSGDATLGLSVSDDRPDIGSGMQEGSALPGCSQQRLQNEALKHSQYDQTARQLQDHAQTEASFLW